MAHRKVKLVHVSTVGVTATRLLLPQCSYFRQQGMDVGFVFSPGPEAAVLREKGFAVKEIPIDRDIKPINDLHSIWRLIRYFRSTQPDIVHTHTSKAGLAGRMAARMAGVPVVIHTVHGFPFHEGMPRGQIMLYQLLERIGTRISTAVLSQSIEDVETAARLGFRSKIGGLIHIGNGIDVNRFSPSRFSPEQRTAIRRALGLGPSTIVLTTVARFNQLKGYPDLINAIARLPEGDWHLLCIGEDEGHMTEIKKQIKTQGLEGKVSLLGPRQDIPEILSITDIYVLASYREGVPRSVIEAQAMEVPAVVTNVRGSREVVIDGETGLLVPPRDPASLAVALQRLIDDGSLRKNYGLAGRKRVLQEFDETKVFERIWGIYTRLLERQTYQQLT